jgi:hypothetical protein
MARIPDRTGTEYDSYGIRRDNEPLFEPKREPSSKFDRGLLPITGMGHGQGMRPRYESEEEMNFAINLYFQVQKDEKRPPTMAGMALALGFKSTRALRNYELKSEEYAMILEMARTRVEEWKNEKLLTSEKQVHGIIFDLKNNHGWADRVEQTTTVEAGSTLSALLQSLQGSVLRPELPPASENPYDAEYADFKEVEVKQEPVEDGFKAILDDPYDELIGTESLNPLKRPIEDNSYMAQAPKEASDDYDDLI